MNFKQFLRPDWRKIVIFIVLLLISLVIVYDMPVGELLTSFRGLPLPVLFFYNSDWHPIPIWYVLLLFGLIDLIFWYLLSCLIIWIYGKIKKKS